MRRFKKQEKGLKRGSVFFFLEAAAEREPLGEEQRGGVAVFREDEGGSPTHDGSLPRYALIPNLVSLYAFY